MLRNGELRRVAKGLKYTVYLKSYTKCTRTCTISPVNGRDFLQPPDTIREREFPVSGREYVV
jgi:hypothetical protein